MFLSPPRLGSLLATTALVLTPLAVTTGHAGPSAVSRPVTGAPATTQTRVHTHLDTTDLVQPARVAGRRLRHGVKHRHGGKRHHLRRARSARPGSGPGWIPMARGVHWSSCRVISYKVNLAGAPAGALDLVNQAFARVHDAGGLTFAFAGTTTKVPFTSANESEDGTIIVAWSTAAQVGYLRGATVGVGGSSWRGSTYTHGGVVLEQGTRVAPGFGNGATEGALLLHEIGHAIGLNHVNRRSEVMYPSVGPWSHGYYGAGDTAGLRALGAAAGC